MYEEEKKKNMQCFYTISEMTPNKVHHSGCMIFFFHFKSLNHMTQHPIVHYVIAVWARIACWLECWTRDRKVVSLNPGRSGGRIFFSRVNFLCWLLFGALSNPMLPQRHIKDPSWWAQLSQFFCLFCFFAMGSNAVGLLALKCAGWGCYLVFRFLAC